MNLDWAERTGFAFCDAGRLRRCSRRMLFRDYPVLKRIRPILSGFHKLDVIAFAAELIELGYCDRVVARAAESSVATVSRLRERMILLGIDPPRVPLVRKHHWATFSAENQPKKAKSGCRGVYVCGDRWRVQRRVQGKTLDYGIFDTLEAATAKSADVFT